MHNHHAKHHVHSSRLLFPFLCKRLTVIGCSFGFADRFIARTHPHLFGSLFLHSVAILLVTFCADEVQVDTNEPAVAVGPFRRAVNVHTPAARQRGRATS